MKRKRIGILVILLIILLLIAIFLSSGCIKKKERYTWDEDGLGKDEWWEPDFSVKANRGEIKNGKNCILISFYDGN